jgi:hypothetical protein
MGSADLATTYKQQRTIQAHFPTPLVGIRQDELERGSRQSGKAGGAGHIGSVPRSS